MGFKTLALAAAAYLWWNRSSQTRKQQRAKADVEDRLDEALDESFPASDPPSITPISSTRAASQHVA